MQKSARLTISEVASIIGAVAEYNGFHVEEIEFKDADGNKVSPASVELRGQGEQWTVRITKEGEGVGGLSQTLAEVRASYVNPRDSGGNGGGGEGSGGGGESG